MAKIKLPIAVVDGNKFQLKIDLSYYTKEVITAAAYKFTDEFFIDLRIDAETTNFVSAIFESKDGSMINETCVKRFCNELIDQQVREDINKEFGEIRDMIVEEAFRPISD